MNTTYKIEVECGNCGVKFLKDRRHVNQTTVSGRNFCTAKCSGLYQHKVRSDDYTPFRIFIRKITSRKMDVGVSIEYLKGLWDRQGGRCVYTAIQLIIPNRRGTNDWIHGASLDRIDSSLGYVEGNVQFVSIAVNNMKNTMTHEQTIELINLIVANSVVRAVS